VQLVKNLERLRIWELLGPELTAYFERELEKIEPGKKGREFKKRSCLMA